MKLYATVTSERATAGQGGKTLDIEIFDEKKDCFARLTVEEGRMMLSYTPDLK